MFGPPGSASRRFRFVPPVRQNLSKARDDVRVRNLSRCSVAVATLASTSYESEQSSIPAVRNRQKAAPLTRQGPERDVAAAASAL